MKCRRWLSVVGLSLRPVPPRRAGGGISFLVLCLLKKSATFADEIIPFPRVEPIKQSTVHRLVRRGRNRPRRYIGCALCAGRRSRLRLGCLRRHQPFIVLRSVHHGLAGKLRYESGENVGSRKPVRFVVQVLVLRSLTPRMRGPIVLGSAWPKITNRECLGKGTRITSMDLPMIKNTEISASGNI